MKPRLTLVAGLMALAAASTAQAQSSVNLYGLLDLSVGQTKAPGTSGAVKSVDSGNMTTSFFGLKGSEDLGGGLTASFTVESFLRPDAGAAGRFATDNFWARSANVSLSSKSAGTLRLGRITTPFFIATLVHNALGDSFGFSPSIRQVFTSGTVTGDTGWSDAVSYSTPNMGGFSAVAMMAAGEGGGGRNTALSGSYSSGAFSGALSYQQVKKGATVDDTTTSSVHASYDFGAVKLFGQYFKVDNDTKNVDYKISAVGASVPAGPGKVLLQYTQTKASAGAGRKGFAFGYDYFISKRTDLYAIYLDDKVDNLSSGYSYGFGVRHSF
ncbi:porin [Roseateles paludis]|uniref:Porin n=1 Tax=Roseateles paludis TaxID=3145238 RepID=A0ABV0FVB0_9BURK